MRASIEPIELDDDDRPIGRFLSRREILVLFGAAGTATALAACGPTGGSPSTSASATAVATGTASASQLFFDDDVSRGVYAAEPYSSKGAQDVENEGDGIFGQSDGTTLLDAKPSGDGYAATFSIALQTS